jgi:hypothetical protein
MANITIKINTAGGSFEEDAAVEVAGLLRMLANTIVDDGLPGVGGPLHDSAGEFCGEVDVQE